MFKKTTLRMLSYALAITVFAAIATMPPALAESVTVYGQVTVNGEPVNGATVSCNGNTTTTSSSIYNGFYTMSLPIGKNYPITATYTANGTTYTGSENIDLTGTTSTSSPIGLNALALSAQATATPTPTPTPTPSPNATVSPSPSPNATVSPSPSANASITPTPTVTATPTATPKPASYTQPSYPTYTPTPTPEPTATPTPTPVVQRKVFSSPKWETDHGTITVSNVGDVPITVRSWVGEQSDNTTIPIKANETAIVLTPSILTEENQIVDMGFEAYENDILIDSYKASLYMNPTSTPVPTKAQSPGFAGTIALAGLLAAGYLITRKED